MTPAQGRRVQSRAVKYLFLSTQQVARNQGRKRAEFREKNIILLMVKGQTQKGRKSPLSSNPKHSKNENSLKKQALDEPYIVHARVSQRSLVCRARKFASASASTSNLGMFGDESGGFHWDL